MEDNSIIEIHEAIYDYLLNNHPNLRFTLRQIDRGERLSKGYWFTGNDNYLAFSFWNGSDWRNKTSNIFFSIDKDGTCWLNFVSNDDDLDGKKSSFLKEAAELLGMFKRPKRAEDPTKQDWVKKYEGNDYLTILDAFIKGDKKTIDTLVRVANATFFSSIEERDFNRWKENIEAKRKKISTKMTAKEVFKVYSLLDIVRLKALTIENISLFKEKQTLNFHERLTCIIGSNGSGKTSLLRSIVLGFTGYEQEESLTTDNSKLDKIQKLLKITGELENSKGLPKYVPSGSINLTYEMDSLEHHNQVLFTVENNKPIIKDASAFKSIKDKNYQTLFLAFAQEQNGTNHRTSDTALPNVEDAMGVLYGEADNRFERFAAWLRKINNISNDKKARGESNLREQELFNKIFEIISKIIGAEDDKISLHKIVVKDGIEDPIWVKIGKNSEPILLDLVSQGFNNVFGWAGYLITRLNEVADTIGYTDFMQVPPKMGISDFMQVPAIVLIDEIDTYLHPSWQARILAVLVDMFPNVQFVVTTHSPYVVGSVPQNLMRLYVCKAGDLKEFTDFTPYGADIERLTRQFFETPVRNQEILNLVKQLESAIQSNEFSKADDMLNSLKSKGIDEDDPEIGSLKIVLRTKKRKAGL